LIGDWGIDGDLAGKLEDLGLARRVLPMQIRTPDQLRARTKKFALDVLRLAKAVPQDPINNEIAAQLADAASSGGAAYRSACRARSRADFIYKLGNSIEEIDEAAFWLEILTESGICADSMTRPLWKEADELTRILVRSRETCRANRQSAIRNKSQITNP
jgi:four helix bundle protein